MKPIEEAARMHEAADRMAKRIAERRELCGLLNIDSTGCASEKQEERISELWAKHMEGGEG